MPSKDEMRSPSDCVGDPRKCWLKPLSDLTTDERVLMDECDRAEAEAYSAMIDRLPTPPSSGEGR